MWNTQASAVSKATPGGTRIAHRVTTSGPAWQQYAQTLGKKIERGLTHTVADPAGLAESLEGA